ncbi:MAG: hypothetical protein JXX28_09165 [Deltaproteobacteria bacterium]|nr:hypothetical protein [Deltaproteobacteria bacterium]
MMFVALVLLACGDEPQDDTQQDDTQQDDTQQSVEGMGYRGLTDQSFSCEDNEEDCDGGCDGNRAPTVGAPQLVVNGAPASEVAIGDHLVLRFPFEDLDDNLGCGEVSWSLIAPSMAQDSSAWLCSNFPGGTALSGLYLEMDMGTLTAGSYSATVRLSDLCAEPSDRAEWSREL